MAGRAKSDVDKAYARKRVYEALMVRAVAAYKADQKKPKKDRRGYRKICLDFESLQFEETGKYINAILNDIQLVFLTGNHIKLSYTTLKRHVAGGMSRERASADRSWLTDSEVDIVIDFINEMVHRGFPLSHAWLKEHVDDICSARLGASFPIKGVGENWTYRFSKKYSERIKISHSRPLEDKRGRATNPHNNEAWWKLLGETITKYKIKEENTYATDEVGIQAQGGGEREYVFGPRTKAAPYQQRSGTRENITTIVTICADGTSTPPAVIFKGSAYQVKWGENNPLNASYVILFTIFMSVNKCSARIGYQQKGWTDGEIGASWMKLFEKATREKANGEYRLLIVDGHNSHYTVAFLLLARLHMVIVICYIAHGTHVYQGLDVVVFAVLKHYLGVERDALLRTTGNAIDKGNFLQVISKAYITTLTPELIKTAFRKTGIWPFNPNVITADMLAPSKETSIQSHLPVPTSSQPVQILATMLRDLQIAGDTPDTDADVISGGQRAGPSSTRNETTVNSTRTRHSTRTTTHLEILEGAVAALKKTNLAFLATPTPTTAADPMPTTTTRTVQQNSIPINNAAAALAIVPTTANELLLLAALRESQSQNLRTEVHAFELQASNILNEAYAKRLCAKLAAREEKHNKKKTIKLVGDGLARLLSGDEFYELAQQKEKEMREVAREKERKKDGRALYKAAVEEWEVVEQERKDAKAVATANLKKAVKAWEKKRDAAKAKGTRFTLIKPKGDPAPKATPKPKLKDFLGAVAEDQEPESSGDDADEGGGSASVSGSDGDNDNDDND